MSREWILLRLFVLAIAGVFPTLPARADCRHVMEHRLEAVRRANQPLDPPPADGVLTRQVMGSRYRSAIEVLSRRDANRNASREEILGTLESYRDFLTRHGLTRQQIFDRIDRLMRRVVAEECG